MDDPSGVQSALAIEAVEWEPAGGQDLLIRVRGRWRRRRPALRGQTLLVIEADGQRHRFPATPEPPSLAGVQPGSWQLSFSVPSWLAPHLASRSWLQLGLALVPLPPPTGPDALASELPRADPDTVADRRVRTAEIAVQRERDRRAEAEAFVADLTARVQTFEEQLAEARREADRLRAVASEHQRARRAAEQRAHAEHAFRLELEEALDTEVAEDGPARAVLGELAASEDRVRQLEAERDQLLARLEQAEQRQRQPEQREPEQREREPERATPAGNGIDLTGELATASALRPAPPPPAARPVKVEYAERRALARERELVALAPSTGRSPAVSAGDAELLETVKALRRELEARTASEARVRAELASALARRQRPASDRSGELTATLGALRVELVQLREIVERESEQRAHAQARVAELERELRQQADRSARVYEALAELRGMLDAARGRPGPGQTEAERLDAARTRLREATPPIETAAALAADEAVPDGPRYKPWLEPTFKALAGHDPAAAGRLLFGLLPAQGLVHPEPIAYDLRLGSGDYVQVTVGESSQTIVERSREPRSAARRAFWIEGDAAAVARSVAAGPVRRRLGRGMARIEGSRPGARVLRELIRTPASLGRLYDAGVRLEPELALTLAAWMVEPGWTAGERFTIAHETGAGAGDAYLHVRHGERISVSDTAPLAPVATTIVCPGDELLAVLAGRRGDRLSIRGDEGPLATLLGWLERAQRS
jgi:hypothetical protein